MTSDVEPYAIVAGVPARTIGRVDLSADAPRFVHEHDPAG